MFYKIFMKSLKNSVLQNLMKNVKKLCLNSLFLFPMVTSWLISRHSLFTNRDSSYFIAWIKTQNKYQNLREKILYGTGDKKHFIKKPVTATVSERNKIRE